MKSAKTSLKTNNLEAANRETNGPIHPQPTLFKTYGPYVVLVPFNSVSSRSNSQHSPAILNSRLDHVVTRQPIRHFSPVKP